MRLHFHLDYSIFDSQIYLFKDRMFKYKWSILSVMSKPFLCVKKFKLFLESLSKCSDIQLFVECILRRCLIQFP